MMIDFTQKVAGAAVWIWLFFFLNIFIIAGSMIYLFREKTLKAYYSFRYPERLIKIIIHYGGGFYRTFYRLVPDKKYFIIDNKTYDFNNKNLIKNNEFFARKNYNTNTTEMFVDGVKYIFEETAKIKARFEKYPEIHYFYNIPNPILFSSNKHEIELSGIQLTEFHENDLFHKLLSLRDEARLLIFCIILSGLAFLCSLGAVLKLFEVI